MFAHYSRFGSEICSPPVPEQNPTSYSLVVCQPPPQECPWDQEVLRGIEIWKISLVTTAQLRPLSPENCSVDIFWVGGALAYYQDILREDILMLRGTQELWESVLEI